MKMRGDKNTHSKGERVKILLLPTNQEKGAGQRSRQIVTMHNRDVDIFWVPDQIGIG